MLPRNDALRFVFQACLLNAYLYGGGAASAFSVENSGSSTRREMIGETIASTFGAAIASSSGWVVAPDAAKADEGYGDAPFSSYQVFPDPSASLDPSLKTMAPPDLNRILAMTDDIDADGGGGGAVWLGEHHNSARDHRLQADFVKSIHDRRRKKFGEDSNGNMAVGLEMVQLQFQPALDAYLAKKISAEEMRKQVQWDKRWTWSFENYLPVFEACRERNVPLVALNVDSEDLGLVELGGFPNLPREKLRKYMSDPAGFARFATEPYYKTYVDYVISPSYELHQSMGILRTTITGVELEEDMPFSRFFSGRILWDESMASNAYGWTRDNKGGLMIGLVGADHVKFEGGITGRYRRLAEGSRLDCISVILNPTLIDTRPSGTVSMASNSAAAAAGAEGLTLQLRYLKKGVDVGSRESRGSASTGGVLALADYLVLS